MIGFGYDIHRLEEGQPLTLGGVHFADAPRGTVAHSDGDVLVHSIMDALLGAMALGDIGLLFPDTDPAYRNADSIALLKIVGKRVAAEGGTILNIDSTVVLEQPRLREHIDAMRKNIANALGLDIGRVSVKATTNEGVDAIGRMEAVAAYAAASVERAE